MKTKLTFILLLICSISFGQKLRDSVYVKTNIFEVVYSEKLEQPKWLKYESTNRPKNVERTGLDFYIVTGIHTSDAADYAKNEYDKGHLAPAATFADTEENMKATFSYLNCALQQQDFNRGEWRLLEEQERVWDDTEALKVLVRLKYGIIPNKLSTGASIPSQFQKHIYFTKQKRWECYFFPNVKPNKSWKEYKHSCVEHK
jgi:DNA/RNA endonuclease G (NUC1)